jgi:hypothetical protein
MQELQEEEEVPGLTVRVLSSKLYVVRRELSGFM